MDEAMVVLAPLPSWAWNALAATDAAALWFLLPLSWWRRDFNRRASDAWNSLNDRLPSPWAPGHLDALTVLVHGLQSALGTDAAMRIASCAGDRPAAGDSSGRGTAS